MHLQIVVVFSHFHDGFLGGRNGWEVWPNFCWRERSYFFYRSRHDFESKFFRTSQGGDVHTITVYTHVAFEVMPEFLGGEDGLSFLNMREILFDFFSCLIFTQWFSTTFEHLYDSFFEQTASYSQQHQQLGDIYIGMSSTDPYLALQWQAADNRDALARALYGIVFNFIVPRHKNLRNSAGHHEVGPKNHL